MFDNRQLAQHSSYECRRNMGLNERKLVFKGLRTTQAQTSPRSLIRAFKFAFRKALLLVKFQGVADATGLKLALSDTPETGPYSFDGSLGSVLNILAILSNAIIL